MELNDINPGDILYFTADWCAPCKFFKPIVKAVEEEFGIAIREINVEEEVGLTRQLGIKSVPTIVQLHPIDRYAIAKRIKGAVTKANLILMLQLTK